MMAVEFGWMRRGGGGIFLLLETTFSTQFVQGKEVMASICSLNLSN